MYELPYDGTSRLIPPVGVETGEPSWEVEALIGITWWPMSRVTTVRDGPVLVMSGVGVLAFAPEDGELLYQLP